MATTTSALSEIDTIRTCSHVCHKCSMLHELEHVPTCSTFDIKLINFHKNEQGASNPRSKSVFRDTNPFAPYSKRTACNGGLPSGTSVLTCDATDIRRSRAPVVGLGNPQ